jgi:lipopolysaccharide heptosyltransferase II
LIVKTSSIGDVIHALPVADIIKSRRPNAYVGWVVRKRCAALLDGNPAIDRIYVMPDRPSVQELLDIGRSLRADHYEVALDMQGLLLSGVITMLSGAKRRVGLDLNRECNRLFLNEAGVPARADRDRHAIDILRGFLPAIGIESDADWPRLSYLAHGESLPSDLARLERGKGLVALNVGASSVYKQWSARSWADLARRLSSNGYSPIVVGGPQDEPAAAAVAVESGLGDRTINLAGRTTLRGLAAVLASCDLLVSADTGPLHVAAGVGTPVVALFGPTNPLRTGPYGKRNEVIWKHLECSPCFRKPTCDGRVDCMKAITVDEVLAAVERMLKRGAIS